jgi:hypothetical protein
VLYAPFAGTPPGPSIIPGRGDPPPGIDSPGLPGPVPGIDPAPDMNPGDLGSIESRMSTGELYHFAEDEFVCSRFAVAAAVPRVVHSSKCGMLEPGSDPPP